LAAAAGLALGLSLGTGGCATSGPPAPPRDAWTRTELFFGLSRPGEPPVSDEEWKAFVAEEVVPRLPEGFTVLSAAGHWSDAAGGHDEDSRLLLVAHPEGGDVDRRLEEIREAYRSRFHQKSVLRLDSPAWPRPP